MSINHLMQRLGAPNSEAHAMEHTVRPFQFLFLFLVRGRVGFWPSIKKKKRKMFRRSESQERAECV